jgi:hypothetical protein
MLAISVNITKSESNDKKMKAFFVLDNGGTKTIHFGSKGVSDYTIHKDKKRKNNYMIRHKKRENWKNPLSAGSLSRYILWNKEDLNESIKDFKKKSLI